MKKLFLLLALFIIPYSLFTDSVHASAEFSTIFSSVYHVYENKPTHVEHHIEIKNKLANIYTKEYTITLGGSDFDRITAKVNGQIAVVKSDSLAAQAGATATTTLTIPIVNPAIGQDQILNLDLSYDTSDLVDHYGKVWEINIPRLLRANEAEQYSREIIVPAAFGQATVQYPKATTVTNNADGETVYTYRGFPSDSLTLLFGNHADYRLELKYTINNPTVSPAKTELALPPDTEYQKVLLDRLDPSPLRLKVDSDGNWLAVYSLRAQESREVNAVLFISVYPYPYYPTLNKPGDSLTQPDKYWESKADNVKTLSGNLKTPEKIYNYLTSNLSYDEKRLSNGGERFGAAVALSQPASAICTEFTDSFIALARASGIPAREINGYAHTNNPASRPSGTADTLHAWPEYYDPEQKTWVEIDPTWGNTTGGVDYFHKLDFGHLTFVRHGAESTYPYPAGSYKTDPSDKTISVTVADQLPPATTTISLKPVSEGYLITNTGNTALVDYQVKLGDGSDYLVKYLPPYGQETAAPASHKELSIWQRLFALLGSFCGKLKLCAH